MALPLAVTRIPGFGCVSSPQRGVFRLISGFILPGDRFVRDRVGQRLEVDLQPGLVCPHRAGGEPLGYAQMVGREAVMVWDMLVSPGPRCRYFSQSTDMSLRML